MRKLITMILILALLLPAAALAEGIRITDRYSLHIDSYAGNAMPAKGGSFFSFDSLTIDIYFTSDPETAYMIVTKCASGIFLNGGMCKVRNVSMDGQTYLVDDAGNHYVIWKDEDGSLWIVYGTSQFKMQHVDHLNAYEDWKQ